MVVGFGGLLFGYIGERGVLANLLLWPPALIVFGGTIGSALIAYPLSNIKRIPSALRLMVLHKKHDYSKLVDLLCDVANKARKDGLLSLEAEAEKMPDKFIGKGLGYIADGVDPEFLKKVLYNEIEADYQKYEDAARIFEGMGGTSPTMGVLGTVMSMVTILGRMASDTSNIGREISSAFIATMYGIGTANLVWLPIGSNIKLVAEQESLYREVVVEGLLAIQSGEPSTRLRDRLLAKIGNQKHNTGNSRSNG